MKKLLENVILWYDARVQKKWLVSEHEKAGKLLRGFKNTYVRFKRLVGVTVRTILYGAVDLVRDIPNALFLFNPTSFCYLAVLCANWIVFFVLKYENHK
jgi:hypothetical protein